jgi:hypothetical protein
LTGRLFDIETNPGLETRWVKDHADRIEAKMLDAVKRFLGTATQPPKESPAEALEPKIPPQAAAASGDAEAQQLI